MPNFSRLIRTLATSLVVVVASNASGLGAETEQATAREAIGTVDFGVSCDSAVRDDFDHAVGLLHHMMYVEARAAFERIAAQDQDCAMAHWGMAMTLFQPLWPTRPSPEDLEQGRHAIERARELGPATDRDKALVAATAAFFEEPEAGWWTRIERWADAMEDAYRAHSDDLETGAFYALSVVAQGQSAEDRIAYNAKAAKVLLEIYEQVPTHPGAIHYTIHANDIEGRAKESLDVVRSYGSIAPNVPHALHMPTHIFVRLGEWPEVIEWNRKSADAALAHPAGEAVSHHYPHATDYLLYAYLQRGEDGKASAVLDETLGKAPFQKSFISAFHLAAMPARYAVERRAWRDAASLEPRRPASLPWDQYPWAEGLSWFTRGLGSAHVGELEEAHLAEERLEALRDRAEAAGERDLARYIEINRLVLAGQIAHAEGRSEDAVDRLRAAAELEAKIEKHPVTPGALLPPNEALGDLLLELDRPVEARRAYEASLKAWPGRYNTLLGAGRAAEATGDHTAARVYYTKLLEVAAPGASRPGMTRAKAYVEGGEE